MKPSSFPPFLSLSLVHSFLSMLLRFPAFSLVNKLIWMGSGFIVHLFNGVFYQQQQQQRQPTKESFLGGRNQLLLLLSPKQRKEKKTNL